jgi:hypothetical protein
MGDSRSFAARLGTSDPRSLREIDGEIQAELNFHLECRAEENILAGMTPDDARRAAADRFGDLERIHIACRHSLLGERIMLQRLQTGLIAILLLAVLGLGYQSFSSQRAHEAALANITQKLSRVTNKNSTEGDATVTLPPAWEAERPRVVETFPLDGSTDVDPATNEIRVTFDKPMADGCWSWVRSSPEQFPESTGDVHYLDGLTTCVMPVKLEPDTKYVVWFNTANYQNFKDHAGRPAVPHLLTFTTRK